MKKLIIILLILSAFQVKAQNSFVNSNDENAEGQAQEENKISVSFEMNYLRHYLWRGMLFGNNDVAQPQFELSYKGITLALAQNFNYDPRRVPKEFYTRNAVFDEQDVTINYSRSWGKFSIEAGAMAYFYFYQPLSPSTAEVYNYSSYNFYKGFSLFTQNSIDVAAYKGAFYSNTGILFEKSNRKNVDFECSLYAAYANKKFNSIYYYEAGAGLNLAGANISIAKNMGKYFVKASAEKNIFIRNAVKEATSLNGTQNFSIAAGINF